MVYSALNVDFLELLQESFVAFDLEGRISSWNNASEELYGWKHDEAIGRSIGLIGGHSLAFRAMTDRDLQSFDRWAGDLERVAADGRQIVVAVRLSLTRDPSGKPMQWIETGVDVTAHRHAERALATSEARYRHLFHSMPAAFYRLNGSAALRMLADKTASGVADMPAYLREHPAFVRALQQAIDLIDFNDSGMKLLDIDPRDLGSGIAQYWPDDTIAVFAEALIAAMNGNQTFTAEIRHRARDGREFDAIFTASYPDDMAETGIFMANVVDNSILKRERAARAQREAFYRDMFHASAIASWHLDATKVLGLCRALRGAGVGSIREHARSRPGFLRSMQEELIVVDANETALTLFGARQPSDIIGKSVAPFWIEEDDEAFVASLETSFRRESSYRGETRMRTLDGNTVDVLFTMSASQELRAAGQVLIAIVDVTDRVRAEMALAEMEASHAHAARVSLLGELTATIAHEVNQPLAAISTNGEAGLRWLDHSEYQRDEVRALMRDIIDDAKRASNVISRIRAMASPEAPPRRPLDLNDLIRDVMMFVRPQLQKANVEVTLDLDPLLPDVLGDLIQVQQVFVNLLMNAMQAMNGFASPTIHIVTARAQGIVTASVRDTGPGLPAMHSARVFDSFFTTKPDGMGIGLAICRSIVEAHGGCIEINNVDLPRGAEVRLKLPADAQAI